MLARYIVLDRVKKSDCFDIFFVLLILAMPFTTLLNNVISDGDIVFGLGWFTLVVDLFLCFGVLYKGVASPSGFQGKECILAFLGLLFFFLLKLFLAQDLNGLVDWFAEYQYYFLIPLFFIYVLNANFSFEKLIKASLLAAFVIAVFSLYFFFSGFYPYPVSQNIMDQYAFVGTGYTRMLSMFASPNVAGTFFVIMLIADLQIISKNTVFCYLRRVVFGLCLLLTFSRMALLGLVGYLVASYFMKTKKSFSTKVVIAVGFCLLFLVFALIMSASGVYFWSFNSDIYDNPRLSKWGLFLSSVGEYVLVGAPLSSHVVSEGTTLSDNSFLLSIGGFGLICAVVYWVFLIRCIIKRFSKPGIFFPLGITLLCFLLLSDFISFYPTAYYSVMLIVYLADKEKDLIDEDLNCYSAVSVST